MAGKLWDGQLKLGDEVIDSGDHGLAHVAHDRARRAEAPHDLAEARQDEVGPLGGDLPGAEHPLPPARGWRNVS
jgi:hypothetical protein